MNSEEYLNQIEKQFASKGNPEIAQQMEAYMRNQFRFLGIKAPLRKELLKPFLAKANRPPLTELNDVIKHLWKKRQREYQVIAMEIANRYKNEMDAGYFSLLEYMITNKSWWDTVDYIASNLVGNLVIRLPEQGEKQINKWRYSGNLWLLRTCIIFQLKYKDKVDEALLFSLIEENINHPDFFIRKAIGWALRQYAKSKPDKVIAFVDSHDLSGLSKREALKNL
jgi:3-methyladenine DNA glycosylase AlkD